MRDMQMSVFDFAKLTSAELDHALSQECANNKRLAELLNTYIDRALMDSRQRLLKYPPDTLTAQVANRELGRQEVLLRILSLVLRS